jgi:hypothetical protein
VLTVIANDNVRSGDAVADAVHAIAADAFLIPPVECSPYGTSLYANTPNSIY